MPKRNLVFNDAGFTLLEIIAVMVIMSILAVVAVPKYFDLQAQARDKAMQTALAEAIGRVNSYFAEQVLSGVLPENIVYSEATLTDGDDPATGRNMDDFDLSVTDPGDGTLTLTVTAGTDTPVAGADAVSKTIRKPGVESGG